MTIVKKVFGPRKVILASQSEDGSIKCDPCVDIEQSDIKEYWESYFDSKHLKIKQGEQPTYFTIKSLTRRQREYASQFYSEDVQSRAQNWSDLSSWFIRCGLIGITNYRIETDGVEQIIDAVELKQNGQYGEIISVEFLDILNLSEEEKFLLFQMIQHITTPSLPLLVASSKASGQTQCNEPATTI